MLNIVRLIFLYFIIIVFTLLVCVRVGGGETIICSFDDTQQGFVYAWNYQLPSPSMSSVCDSSNAAFTLHPPVFSFSTKQISETTSQTGEEWSSASLTGCDLLHVPWDGFPVIVPMMVFISSPHESTPVRMRDHNICWIQMRRPSRWWQRSATVPQGALSPSGRGRATSASTWLDSPIKWHHEFCLMDVFCFFFKGPTHCFITSIQSQPVFLINIPFLVEHPHCWVLYKNN